MKGESSVVSPRMDHSISTVWGSGPYFIENVSDSTARNGPVPLATPLRDYIRLHEATPLGIVVKNRHCTTLEKRQTARPPVVFSNWRANSNILVG